MRHARSLKSNPHLDSPLLAIPTKTRQPTRTEPRRDRTSRSRSPARQLSVERYLAVRAATTALLEGINEEDAQVQSMPDASPIKWHMAHTTWFFETFVLGATPSYEVVNPAYGFLFNSYYETVGPRVVRAQRGMLTRPSLREVTDYRRVIDDRMVALLGRLVPNEIQTRIELGLHHEQQHQELMLMDIKHLFGHQPLLPAYRERPEPVSENYVLASGEFERQSLTTDGSSYTRYPGGLTTIGYDGPEFHFDNESPAHPQYVAPFELAQRLVTNGEYLEFIDAGGYERPELWLSDGYRWLTENDVRLPLYWRGQCESGRWHDLQSFTLHGVEPLDLDEPVCHLSYYEADAYARWVGARLPSEAEWESAARSLPVTGNFLESGRLRPCVARHDTQLFGDVWEWTQSTYAPFPGYRAAAGALGEYNGKFMCNQMVLKGGSCITPRDHVRASYRNFFAPHCRWQFSGVRLARDV